MSDKKVKEIYLPDVVGKGYREFWNFKGRFRVCKGSRASKKSKTTALNFIVRIMEYPDSNLLVVRKTFRTLKDSCFAELKWAVSRLGADDFWECKYSPLEMTYKPTGQKIYFRGLDDPFKVTSITVTIGALCWLWIEEAYEITKEEDFNILQESIRGKVPKGLFKQITLTFNPWNELHWLKARFFDVIDDDILAVTTNYMCNEWLDEADRRMFEDMRVSNPKRYKVAGLGEWGVVDGVVFDNWRVDDLTEIIQTFSNIYNGLDFGFSSDPTAFIKIHFDHAQKKIYVFQEMYKCGLHIDELAEEIKSLVKNQYVICDSASPQNISDLNRRGIRAIPAVKGPNSINFGILWLQGCEIIIHKDCKNFKREIANYQWEKDKFGNVLNRPVDKDNHLMDALRYATEQLQSGIKTGAALRL